MPEAKCFHCKKMVTIVNPREMTHTVPSRLLPSGKMSKSYTQKRISGTCPDCKGKVSAIPRSSGGPKKPHAARKPAAERKTMRVEKANAAVTKALKEVDRAVAKALVAGGRMGTKSKKGKKATTAL